MAEKRNIRRKRNMVLFTIGILMLSWFFAPEFSGGMFPYQVSAKVSQSTQKKAAKAYRAFMDGADYGWFRAIDLNRDGLKELVVSYEQKPFSIIVYQYRKGRVRRVGEDYSMFGYVYHKKMKRVLGYRGGGGSIENWYLSISKSGKMKNVYLTQLENGVKNGKIRYNYYYAGKKISKKAFTKKQKSWNKNQIPFKMYKTSSKNLKKYIR